MSKVFLFSHIFHPTFPYVFMNLYHELKSKFGQDLTFVLQEGDYRLVNPELA